MAQTTASLTHVKQQDAMKLTAMYADHRTKIIPDFLKEYIDPKMLKHNKFGKRKYMVQLQEIANFRRSSLVVNVNDLEAYIEQIKNDAVKKQAASHVGMALLHNTHRYVDFFHEAAASVMPQKDQNFDEMTASLTDEYERTKKYLEKKENAAQGEMNSPDAGKLPTRWLYSFDVRFISEKLPHVPLRGVKAQHVGGLVQIDGIVSKVSLVKPRMEIAQYTCSICNGELFQMVDGDSFLPLKECSTLVCRTNKTSGLNVKIPGSKFIKWQEVKLQENPGEVPVGAVPRSLTVFLQGDICRAAVPGDSITVTGVFNMMKITGPSFKFAESIAYITGHQIVKHKQGYKDEDDPTLEAQIKKLNTSPDLYQTLSESIAPEIFGHSDVKKALLLSLIGGTGTNQQDGMKIRGDIHLMMMGDPGVAKSQLLKQIVKIAPRSIYTTGKGTTGVGLTAGIMRDPSTKEMTLEGGAVVLADRGVCCIDEFDKMEETDRTAIHEVMEQQTLSLAKAGITTVLNTRCTILAAANPAYGRYNPKKSPMENMAMPAALISRFDLKFLLLDQTDERKDLELASHVLSVHRYAAREESMPQDKQKQQLVDAKVLRAYIKKSRGFKPLVPSTLRNMLIARYVDSRKSERNTDVDERMDYTTPRSLLAILRLCQALARLRFSDKVSISDYDEAIRLCDVSKESVLQRDDDEEEVDDLHQSDTYYNNLLRAQEEVADTNNDSLVINPMDMQKAMRDYQSGMDQGGARLGTGNQDEVSVIFELIRAELTRDGGGAVFDADMRQKIIHRGYTEDDYGYARDMYLDLRVLEWSNAEKTAYRFSS